MSTETSSGPLHQAHPLSAIRMLSWREILRFFRQRNRVIGALGQPILFWLLFGAGLHQSFSLPASGPTETSFLEYYFPGSLVLILLFTAIFATISIIEDRREGFLQAVLVAPIARWCMVLGKILGGALIATSQGLIFLALALTLDIELTVLKFLNLATLLFVTSLALTSLGFVLAWRMESTQGFHAIMNLGLMPMWLLSGAFFPVPSIVGDAAFGQHLMHWLMRANPLTYTVAAVRHLLYESAESAALWMPTLLTSWIVTAVFAVLAFFAAWRIAATRTSGDLL